MCIYIYMYKVAQCYNSFSVDVILFTEVCIAH